MRKIENVLVTGGCGFIGSNFIRSAFERSGFSGRIINVDKLTYAGNPLNLQDIADEWGGSRYVFVQADICDTEKVQTAMDAYDVDTIVHFAAESHVDRSITGPQEFIRTNVNGTFSLLECARKCMDQGREIHFHHVSTDEVFGSLGETGFFYEDTPYDPRSPYSSSKAGSDHLVRAYFHTYGLSVTISNCSNNYGPYQFPEKLIPLMILNIREGKELPVYGDGKNIRDWIHVDDHNQGVWSILEQAQAGQTYNLGGENEWENIRLVHTLCELLAQKDGKDACAYKGLITFVTDRPGHDRRYAINCDKIKKDLGWKQMYDFESGLHATVDWYLQNSEWIECIRTGDYRKWIEQNYTGR